MMKLQKDHSYYDQMQVMQTLYLEGHLYTLDILTNLTWKSLPGVLSTMNCKQM